MRAPVLSRALAAVLLALTGGCSETTATPTRDDHSVESGHAARQRRLAALLPLQSPRAEHEPQGQLPGQLGKPAGSPRKSGNSTPRPWAMPARAWWLQRPATPRPRDAPRRWTRPCERANRETLDPVW